MKTLGYILIVIFIYILPSLIGYHTKNSKGIITLNLLLGWTFLGWVASLIWALMSPASQPSYIYACEKCGYKSNLNQRVKLYLCPQCKTENIIVDFEEGINIQPAANTKIQLSNYISPNSHIESKKQNLFDRLIHRRFNKFIMLILSIAIIVFLSVRIYQGINRNKYSVEKQYPYQWKSAEDSKIPDLLNSVGFTTYNFYYKKQNYYYPLEYVVACSFNKVDWKFYLVNVFTGRVEYLPNLNSIPTP